ncbi:hypothetical protein EDB85DRAFT_1894581 [Lactarius pseudohatsudake]|nr:hypothetical protein EDB85DRAFT_1894581 [Lactarius pseudohatsudake]
MILDDNWSRNSHKKCLQGKINSGREAMATSPEAPGRRSAESACTPMTMAPTTSLSSNPPAAATAATTSYLAKKGQDLEGLTYALAMFVQLCSDRRGFCPHKWTCRDVEDYLLKLTQLTARNYPSFLGAEAGSEVTAHYVAIDPWSGGSTSFSRTWVFLRINGLRSRLTVNVFVRIEQASGHGGHDTVAVITNEKGADLDGALT